MVACLELHLNGLLALHLMLLGYKLLHASLKVARTLRVLLVNLGRRLHKVLDLWFMLLQRRLVRCNLLWHHHEVLLMGSGLLLLATTMTALGQVYCT